MPFPLVRPITNIIEGIHNATITRNQDEFLPLRGVNRYSLLKNSVEKFHSASETRGAPRQSDGKFPQPAPLPPPLAGSGGGTGYARRVRLLRERRKGPRVVRENDCCFILGEAIGPKGVGGISFFPRLFLDSPTGTPYLVCVINIHHKIRYH